MRQLGIDDDSDARSRIKGHAANLGIDISHLGGRGCAPSASVLLSSKPETSRLRFVAEAIAVAWFGVRAIPVAVPTQVSGYDLLLTLTSGVKRVQVKSSTFRPKHGTWVVGVGHRPYSLDKTAGHAPYDPDEIDYFFIVVGDGGLYFIPSAAVGGMTSISIGAYEGYRVGDASSLITVAA